MQFVFLLEIIVSAMKNLCNYEFYTFSNVVFLRRERRQTAFIYNAVFNLLYNR